MAPPGSRTLLLLLSLAGVMPGQVVVNGDFEDVNISPNFFSFDSTQMPGWTRGGSLGDGLLAQGFIFHANRSTNSGIAHQWRKISRSHHSPRKKELIHERPETRTHR